MLKGRSHRGMMWSATHQKGKNYLFDIQSIGKECNMEMCYDGVLVMPNNYAVVDEEEMTYVDGGTVYCSDASTLEPYFLETSNILFTCAAIAGVSVGAAIAYAGCCTSNPVIITILAAVGVLAGFATATCMANSAKTCKDAARTVKDMGHTPCFWNAELYYGSLYIDIWKA